MYISFIQHGHPRLEAWTNLGSYLLSSIYTAMGVLYKMYKSSTSSNRICKHTRIFVFLTSPRQRPEKQWLGTCFSPHKTFRLTRRGMSPFLRPEAEANWADGEVLPIHNCPALPLLTSTQMSCLDLRSMRATQTHFGRDICEDP
ncbi:hypothetical protein BDV06DRAFT_19386 [Aspergillus oleicola]